VQLVQLRLWDSVKFVKVLVRGSPKMCKIQILRFEVLLAWIREVLLHLLSFICFSDTLLWVSLLLRF
jgi:hypothetical protein